MTARLPHAAISGGRRRPRTSPSPPFNPPSPSSPHARFFGHFGFGGMGQQEEPETPKGETVMMELAVTLEDLYLGKTYTVRGLGGGEGLPVVRDRALAGTPGSPPPGPSRSATGGAVCCWFQAPPLGRTPRSSRGTRAC